MIKLVRQNLENLISQPTEGHAGLLMQRGLKVWEKEDKQALIELITSIQPSELYLLAFNRWLCLTQADQQGNATFAVRAAMLDGRLFTGLSTGGTLETGVITQHSYGMPMLPGSSVKGAVRAYAENLFLLKDASGLVILDEKGKTQINPAMKEILNILFGMDEDAECQNAGYLIWHDAWWIPVTSQDGKLVKNDRAKPFVGEIVTVHHQKYYSDKTGRTEALDMESPIPNQQIAVQGGFYFVIEGEPQWVEFAKDLLDNMLMQMGMGAKGASGYGYFKSNESLLSEQLLARYERLDFSQQMDLNSDDPSQAIRREIKFYKEDELVESLSKGINKLFDRLNLNKDDEEDRRLLTKLVFEYHESKVSTWASVEGQKNTEKAWKFLSQNK